MPSSAIEVNRVSSRRKSIWLGGRSFSHETTGGSANAKDHQYVLESLAAGECAPMESHRRLARAGGGIGAGDRRADW